MMFTKGFRSLLAVGSLALVLCNPVTAKAATTWKQAYRKVVKEVDAAGSKWSSSTGSKSKLYALVYIDKNNVPELVCSDGPTDTVYTFYKGAAVKIFSGGSWMGGDHGRYYIPRKNILYDENADYAGAMINYCRFSIKKGKLKSLSGLYSSVFNDTNGNKKIDSSEMKWDNIRKDGKYSYYMDNKKITKKKFKQVLKGSVSLKGTLTKDKVLNKLK